MAAKQLVGGCEALIGCLSLFQSSLGAVCEQRMPVEALALMMQCLEPG